MNWRRKSIVSCVEQKVVLATWRGLGAVLGAVVLLAGCAGDAPRSPAGGPASSGPGSSLSWPASKARNWEEYKRQAGQRMLAANPRQMHDGAVEQPSLAIPVLKVVLNGDGAVQKVEVVRRPSQAADTTQLAIDAVKRGGPYGAVAHLPKPWEFTEAFLFNEDRRFKPATLDR
jgi:hypothetical protein